MQKLSKTQVRRYSRQLILDKIGLDAQKRICESSVLVVGAGGLGCPVLMALAGAGVGRIGVVDHDTVCVTNLHRQTIYSTQDESRPKAECAKEAILRLNPTVRVEAFCTRFCRDNGKRLVSAFDVVADCTDNVDSRYLINDISVLCRKPVVYAAAIGVEGQLSVYNYNNGPCMRCVFPERPPESTERSCSDNGVLGAVPAVMGSLQAVEVLKVAGGFGQPLVQQMLYYNALEASFKRVKMRGRGCRVCDFAKANEIVDILEEKSEGDSSVAKKADELVRSLNPERGSDQGGCAVDERVENEAGGVQRVSVAEFDSIRRRGGEKFVLVDVRDETQYKICSIDGSLNLPLEMMAMNPESAIDKIRDAFEAKHGPGFENSRVFVMCRRGISSLKGAVFLSEAAGLKTVSIDGGLEAWAREVDTEMAMY